MVAMKPPNPSPSPLRDGPGQVLAQGRSVLPQLGRWQRGQEGSSWPGLGTQRAAGAISQELLSSSPISDGSPSSRQRF